VAAFLIVGANFQRFPQPFALFYLSIGHLMDLVFLEWLSRARGFPAGVHFVEKLLPQSVASGIYFILIDSTNVSVFGKKSCELMGDPYSSSSS
jgi:hypothetical protein